MKNSLIDNNGVQVSPNKNLKTKLESQIEQLKSQERQINQQLKFWEAKAKRANTFASYLELADVFGTKFLTAATEAENTNEQVDKHQLERLIRNQVEFNLKFEAGAEAFAKLVLESIERQVSNLKVELKDIQNQLCHQERKFARLQARRQGKTLLECKLNNGLGCLGAYQCDNCKVNYSVANVPESSQLKGGAC